MNSTDQSINTPDPLTQSSASLLGDIILTDEQQTAIDRIIAWFKSPTSPQEFKLGGYAGTGKTTIIKSLLANAADHIHPMIGAFTGKACHVLRKKGIYQAATWHSQIYDCVDNGDSDGTFDFEPKKRLYITGYSTPNLLICDESSMISTDLYRDLRSFSIKILFIGDPGQLEPVGDNPNLMKSPDYVLTKIHRQAELSPIITLASNVRHGAAVSISDPTGSVVIKPKFITDEELSSVDQVLCAKNTTRSLLNRRVRHYLNRLETPISEGEKLICLKNSRRFFMFNGLILYVEKIQQDNFDNWVCVLRDDDDRKYYSVPIWKKPFQSELKEGEYCPPYLTHFDYGYAITVHKSQGSEWDHVLVWHEAMYKTDMKRWCYTAITRAAKKLTYCK